MKRNDLTAEYVRSILDYDPATGLLTWLPRPIEHFKTQSACNIWNIRYVGKRAGCLSGSGYLYIRVCGTLYMAHRLAWLWMTGEWPEDQIDHIDMNRTNIAFANLRKANNAENNQNKCLLSRNTSGFKGVYWRSDRHKWSVQIVAYGKRQRLGHFDEDKKDEAAAAYAKAARELHGEFARPA